MPLQLYAWTLLHLSQPFRASFVSSGQYPRYLLRFSLSGVPQKSDLVIRLDGKEVNSKWHFKEDIGMDRWHYDLKFFEGKGDGENGGLSGGVHVVEFELISPWWDGVAQLCSVEILEFGSEDE